MKSRGCVGEGLELVLGEGLELLERGRGLDFRCEGRGLRSRCEGRGLRSRCGREVLEVGYDSVSESVREADASTLRQFP